MNFDNISKAMMMVFDELNTDPQSKKLIKKIDGATGDAQLKKGIKEGIARIRELGKNSIADVIEAKIKGW